MNFDIVAPGTCARVRDCACAYSKRCCDRNRGPGVACPDFYMRSGNQPVACLRFLLWVGKTAPKNLRGGVPPPPKSDLHVNRTINETLRHDQAHAAPRHNCIKSSKARCNASDNYGCSEWWLVLLEPVAR